MAVCIITELGKFGKYKKFHRHNCNFCNLTIEALPMVAKRVKNAKYYHPTCALKVGLISPEDFEGMREKVLVQ